MENQQFMQASSFQQPFLRENKYFQRFVKKEPLYTKEMERKLALFEFVTTFLYLATFT